MTDDKIADAIQVMTEPKGFEPRKGSSLKLANQGMGKA
jgi:hypothetical protein